MKREVMWMNGVLAVGLVVSASAVRAQETQEAQGPVVIQEGGLAGVQEGPGPVTIQERVVGEGNAFFTDEVEVLGFGGWLHGGKGVKGAPFSAVAVSETTETLADGNHIVRKTQTNLYRDSQGRFRKEVTLPAIGPLAASGQPHTFIEISDPVAGTSYVLEPDQKVARQMPGHMGIGGEAGVGLRRGGGAGGPGPAGVGVYRTFKEGAAELGNGNATTQTRGW